MTDILAALMAFLASLIQDLRDIVKDAFLSAWDWVSDLALEGVEKFLGVISSAIAAIPVPEFLGKSIGDFLGDGGPEILYFADLLNIGVGLGFLAAAFAVRMLRKILTLFQW